MDSEGKATRYCPECRVEFSNVHNLRKHARRTHPDKVQEIAPLLYRNKCNYKYSCEVCDKNFNMERHLRYHMKLHIKEENPEAIENSNKHAKKCPLCPFRVRRTEDILKHFEEEHAIIISCKDFEFPSFRHFEQWLKNEEKKTQSKFVKKRTESFKNHIRIMYMCHRSGMFTPGGNGLRALKLKGSVKINAYCPASIKLVQQNDGSCQIRSIETHVGHSPDTNLDYLYLTKEDRRMLATQIAHNIPFEDILDSTKNSVSNMERIHLLRRKDLHNIKSSLKAEDLEEDLSTDSQSNSSESKEIVQQSQEVVTLDQEKQELKRRFSSFVDSIQSPAKIKIVENFLSSLPSTLNALEDGNVKFPDRQMKGRTIRISLHKNVSGLPMKRRTF